MSEVSDEMMEQLYRDLNGDIERMRGILMERPYRNGGGQMPLQSGQLEQLVYVTEQIRLKLRLLGAPRIYER